MFSTNAGNMYRIAITNAQDILKIDAEFLEQVTRQTLSAERVGEAEISIALVDNATIHDLNVRHLQHDEPTDVLSFLLDCRPPEAAEQPDDVGKQIEGEVVLSVEMAVQRAAEFGWTPHDELLLYLVHGLLHLCGYDDLSEAQREEMRSRERTNLKVWDLQPRYETSSISSVVSELSPGVSGAGH